MPLRISATFDEHYKSFKQHMRSLRSDLIGPTGTSGLYGLLANQNVDYQVLVTTLRRIREALLVMDAAAALGASFVQFVKDEEQDQNYNVVTDYQTMRSALVAIRDWILTNMPKDAGGWWLVITVDQDGNVSHRMFTPAQTAGLRTLIDAYRATVV